MFSVGKIVVFYMFVVTFDKIYGSFSLKIVGRKINSNPFSAIKKKKCSDWPLRSREGLGFNDLAISAGTF